MGHSEETDGKQWAGAFRIAVNHSTSGGISLRIVSWEVNAG